jgi:hypothetical protein
MAAERKRVWGQLAAWHVSQVLAHMPFTAAAYEPDEINPYKGDRPEDPGLARIKAFIARRRWAAACTPHRG